MVLWPSRCDRSGLLAEHALWSASLTSSTECDELYWNAAMRNPAKPRVVTSARFVHAPATYCLLTLRENIYAALTVLAIDYCMNLMASFIWHVQIVSPMANGLPLAQAV